MRTFYSMTADTDVAEYVRPMDSFYKEPCGELTLAMAVRQGKVQFIEPTPITIGIDDHWGLDFPDLLMYENVPLISSKFDEILTKLDIDIPFRRSVTLKDDLTGHVEHYVLIVPPQVDRTTDVGRYKLFTLRKNSILAVTKELKEAVEKANLENVYFDALEDE